MNEDEGGREGGRASMLPCFHWPRFPPDTSASSAVATGDQAAARRPVHQRVHCDRASPHSPTPLSLSLSLLKALRKAPVHQSGDPGRERRAREEQTGAGADSERAHQRAEVQVSGRGAASGVTQPPAWLCVCVCGAPAGT